MTFSGATSAEIQKSQSAMSWSVLLSLHGMHHGDEAALHSTDFNNNGHVRNRNNQHDPNSKLNKHSMYSR